MNKLSKSILNKGHVENDYCNSICFPSIYQSRAKSQQRDFSTQTENSIAITQLPKLTSISCTSRRTQGVPQHIQNIQRKQWMLQHQLKRVKVVKLGVEALDELYSIRRINRSKYGLCKQLLLDN